MNKNNNLYWLIGVLLLIIAFLLAMGLQTPPVIERTDTVTVEKWRTDTFKVDSIVPKYITKIKKIRDTLTTTDSIPVVVDVPIFASYYDTTLMKKDDTLHITLDVEGYKTKINSLEATVNRKEKETIIEHTVTKTKKPLISLSPMAGFGYGVTTKKVDAFIGFGVSINL